MVRVFVYYGCITFTCASNRQEITIVITVTRYYFIVRIYNRSPAGRNTNLKCRIILPAFLILLVTSFNTADCESVSTMFPADKTSLRSFDGGSSVLLLEFDTVKKSSNMEDRVIAHFDISNISGIILSAHLNIPINNFDPGSPEGIISVYVFTGDGKVSTDEWGVGNRLHTFTGIKGNRDTLTVNITQALQSAVDNSEAYLCFSFSSEADRFWLDEGNNVPETYITYSTVASSLANAARNGFIHNYVYTWDGYEYVPVRITDDDTQIHPWQGFVAVLQEASNDYSGINLFIPARSDTSSPPSLDLETGKYYLISPPLLTADTDINGSSLGQQLGPDKYEKTWRISTWQWDLGEYHFYKGPDSQYDDLMSFLPGKGFWLQLLSGSPLSIELEGEQFEPAEGFHTVSLPRNTLQRFTRHMIGNPYCYPITLNDCYVDILETDSTASNITVSMAEDVELWHVGIKLLAMDGQLRDTYNRAGVLKAGSSGLLRALDLEPPGKYIRLSLYDPDQEDPIRYAYDYRESDASKDLTYSWRIELTTTYPVITTTMTIENFDQLPEHYTLAIINHQTNHLVTLHEDMRINTTLYSNFPNIFTLIASPIPIDVNEDIPYEFGFIGIMPNPFNLDATISFSLDSPGATKISVFNISGQLIDILLDDTLDKGIHTLIWNAAGYASGMYFVALDSGKKSSVRKMLLIK